MGLSMGLARPTTERWIGLKDRLALECRCQPLKLDGCAWLIVGEDAMELGADLGIVIGRVRGRRDDKAEPREGLTMGEMRDWCVSLRCMLGGDTARRFDALAWGP